MPPKRRDSIQMLMIVGLSKAQGSSKMPGGLSAYIIAFIKPLGYWHMNKGG